MSDQPHAAGTPAAQAEINRFYSEKLAGARKDAPTQRILSPDYDEADIPDWLEGASFGCGNPVAFSRIAPGETVVDLGCGVGLDLLIAAERTGPGGRVIGIDMNAEMLARARRNAAQGGFGQIELREGRLEALPLEAGVADWVFSNCVINLAADKGAVFAEIVRVLKPGGRLLVSDIVAEDLPGWVALHADLYAACISSAVSQEDYLRAAEGAGLRDLKIIDRLDYDEAALRHLVKEELPVALDALAGRFGLSPEAMLEKAVADLAGKVRAVKLWGVKPAR